MPISLPVYDLVAKCWLPDHCKSTYRNTMLGHLFPNVEFAIGDIGALLAEENVDQGLIASTLDAGFEDYILVGGSNSRKEGKAIYAKTHTDCFTRFFGSNMNASNYGSNLTTECKLIKDISIKLLVVADGSKEAKRYRTGDCHGKCSEKFAMEFAESIYNPFQFRAFNRSPDWCAKGTIAVGFKKGKYDVVLPTSCFKGNKVEPGEYQLSNLAFGLVFKSPELKRWTETHDLLGLEIEREMAGYDFRKSNLSYSVLQFLPWDAVNADIVPIARKHCQEINSVFNNPQKLLEYLLRKDSGNSDDGGEIDGSKLAQVLKADIHGQLSTHPWIVKATARLFAARWREVATSGGMKFNSSMVMPDEDLPDDCCYIPGLADGEEVIVFPYPCRWKYDIKVWTNRVLPKWEQQEGILVVNTKTALKLGRDFDGI